MFVLVNLYRTLSLFYHYSSSKRRKPNSALASEVICNEMERSEQEEQPKIKDMCAEMIFKRHFLLNMYNRSNA